MTPTYRLYAFGSNGESQLGLGYASDKVTKPTLVQNPPNLDPGLRHICGGGNHTLILTKNGEVWGAGSTQSHQLGKHATGVNGIPEFTLLRTHVQFCAATWESSAYLYKVVEDGMQVYTEGKARHGELGRGDACSIYPDPSIQGSSSGQPARNQTMELPWNVVSFAAGMYHYVAVLETGHVYGWGRARNRQLGDTGLPCYSIPVHVTVVPFRARKVVCGQYFTYVVGDSYSGEHVVLGDDKHGVQSRKPAHIRGWKDIGATWNAIFVLFKDGSLKAWGKSDLWQLVPPNLPKLEQIAVGSDHVLALTEDNRVLSWGWAVHGNCGDTGNLKMPLKQGYMTGQYNEIELDGGKVVKIAAGYSTSFVLTTGPA